LSQKIVQYFALEVLYINHAITSALILPNVNMLKIHVCRKNQARKVVCIPAPTAAGGRTTGEVVPSDLWAWRKYGQKPIKGSPYPRYICASHIH
jgi:hypothetical protein